MTTAADTFPGPLTQTRQLIAMRWAMVRSERLRIGFLLLAAVVPGLTLGAIAVGMALPRERAFDIALVAPTVFLGFAVLSLVSPLIGGGTELFPADELVAYPVAPRTHFLASLLLAPLNLAWVVQLVVLFGLTAFLVGPTFAVLPALLLTTAYIVFVTALGQTGAWVVDGVRQTRRGRAVAWGVLAGVLGAVAVLSWTDRLTELLDRAPTQILVIALLSTAGGSYLWWVASLVALTVATAVILYFGARACTWTLGRSGDAGAQRESKILRRREPHGTVLGTLVAVDRASVWRAAALRRGGFVVALLPGAAAAMVSMEWRNLVLIPALVAAASGLLFGVNVFCLDAGGAIWLASQPHRPRDLFLSKTIVLTEFCTVAVLLSIIAGGLRAQGRPTTSEVAALSACALVSLLIVVAACMRASVTRPHRAVLSGNRDTPAPPGAMAVYSVRLAAATTLAAVAFSILALFPWWWVPVIFAVPLLARSLLNLIDSARRFDRGHVRARIVATVAAG